jgi:hypothetical protein
LHPKVQEFYNQTGIDYLPSVQDKLEATFEKASALSKKKSTVEAMYRYKKGGLKSHEYLWYVEKITSRDRKGNAISFEKPVGKYEMPHAQWNFDDEANPVPQSVNEVTTEYEILWSPKLIEEFEEKDMITENTKCYVDTGARKYGQFYLDNFKAKDFEDLVYFGQTGKFPTKEEKEILVGPPSKRMGIPSEKKSD